MGVDIEELVGRVPREGVGALVDESPRADRAEDYEPAALTGNAPSDAQAEIARLSGVWGLGQLADISDGQARDDLGRISAQLMAIVARSARVADGRSDAVGNYVVASGVTAAGKFLLRWRGEADPRHARHRHILDLPPSTAERIHVHARCRLNWRRCRSRHVCRCRDSRDFTEARPLT
jgi:citrate synthase